MWKRWGILCYAGAIFLVLLSIGFVLNSWPPVSVETSLTRGRIALGQQDYSTADRLARRALRIAPDSVAAHLLAARASIGMKSYRSALEHLDVIPDDGSEISLDARLLAGTILLRELYRPSDAEREFRSAAKIAPDHRGVNDSLAFLTRLGSRYEEMVPCELRLIRAGLISPRRLAFLSFRNRQPTDVAYVQKCRATSSDDPLCIMGRVSILTASGRESEAKPLLQKLVRRDPVSFAAQRQLGRLLLIQKDEAEFYRWHNSLPAAMDRDSEIWAIRGAWLEGDAKPHAAVRCYLESVSRDANDQRSTYRAGRLLVEVGEATLAEPFLKRASSLQRYVQLVHAINARKPLEDRLADEPLAAARLAESLGFIWEAFAWFQLARELDSTSSDATRGRTKLAGQITSLPLTRAVAGSNLVRHVEMSRFPLPEWDRLTTPNKSQDIAERHRNRVSFKNDAAAVGINFCYEGNRDPNIQGLTQVYQFLGGGTAVLDYDMDGWPDLYFPQGCRMQTGQADPSPITSDSPLDAIYRNLGDGRFEDVSSDIRITEAAYSHGAAVGDYDCDGFPDIYVGNLGGNCLFHNNGDGTFSDATTFAGTGGSAWTSSCMIADLNGDALPDIYSVNYLSLSQAIETVCRDRRGKRHGCLPAQFTAAQDRLYLNKGDGTFEDVTAAAGIVAPRGKGLGIVAADFDNSGFLSLFVANDGEANFYFGRQAGDVGKPRPFEDLALFRGVAVNRDGLAEACMGVAVGDGDNDGLLDLFVTNFLEESNTFYRQTGGGLFDDVTAQAGLRVPSWNRLGFGTQFIDVDLDGSLDLAVANGHIDLSNNANVPYKMSPQLFLNNGKGMFLERPAIELGTYFERKFLGRAMSRLDWNRDGREDLVVTHLEEKAALLTNRTPDAGHFLTLRLVGVSTNRDAIGSVVRATFDGKTFYRQLCAGDGYLASNQRAVTFGLGKIDRVDKIVIQWPSGRTQEFSNPTVDSELLVVEHQQRLYVFPAESHHRTIGESK